MPLNSREIDLWAYPYTLDGRAAPGGALLMVPNDALARSCQRASPAAAVCERYQSVSLLSRAIARRRPRRICKGGGRNSYTSFPAGGSVPWA